MLTESVTQKLSKTLIRFILIGLCLPSFSLVSAQTTYFWTGGTSGDWTVASNWNTTQGGGGSPRTTPATTDLLVVDGDDLGGGTTGSATITNVPTQTIAAFTVTDNSQVLALQSSGSVTLTITGSAGTSLNIATGTTLNITSFTGTIELQSNLQASGTFNFSPTSSATLLFSGAGGKTLAGSGTLTLGSNLTLEVSTGTLTLARPIDIEGDLLISSGSLDVNTSNHQINLAGDFTVTGGGSFSERDGEVVMDGTTAQVISGFMQFYHLSIDNSTGGVTINSSNTLVEVDGDLTLLDGQLTTNSNLLLTATSNSRYGQIYPPINGSITGNVRIEKRLTNTDGLWRQMSLPVNITLADLHSADLMLNFSGNATTQNVFYWDATDAGGGIAEGWTMATSGMDETRGYTIYSDNNYPGLFEFSTVFDVSGAANAGNYGPYNLLYTNDPNDDDGASSNSIGWNLLPNPYPSNIEPNSLFALSGFPSYKAAHIWNATGGQYVAMTASGVTVYHTNNSALAPTNHVIPMFQAFWVKADVGGNTLTLEDAIRTTEIEQGNIYMKKNRDLVRLNIFGKDSAWDQAVVYFDAGATDDFDNSFDAYKLRSSVMTVPTLYTMIGNNRASINGLPSGKTDYSVPMVLSSNQDGEQYVISANDDQYDMGLGIWLEDHKTGKFTDLSTKPYTFTHDKSYSGNRFTVHFTNDITSVKDMKEANSFVDFYVFSEAGSLMLNYNGTATNAQVLVTDLMGREIYNGNLYNGKQRLAVGDAHGCLIVRVTSGTETLTKKTIR